MSDWYREHFNEDYLVVYAARDERQAEEEVDFAVERLTIANHELVLDLCCGFGRHLKAFQRRGICAVGVDLSAALLREARKVGQPLVRADMRRLPFVDGGDGCGFPVLVSFFTSFGYFDEDDENRRVVSEMARVLQPGGRFLLDLLNPEAAVARLEPVSNRRTEGLEILEERTFDEVRRRIEKRITIVDGESRVARQYFESVRVYSAEEINATLEAAGLAVEGICGDFQGSEVTRDSPRLIVTGRKWSQRERESGVGTDDGR